MHRSELFCAPLTGAHPVRHLVHPLRLRSAMKRRSRGSSFMSRPGNAARQGKPRGHRSRPRTRHRPFTARLTIDVTPDLRARIKIAAFERGVTVAYMLRLLLLKSFPRTKGHRR
jgi:hypothetical protein